MYTAYFNYRTTVLGSSWWDRRRFIAAWWRIYARDPYWVPPEFPRLLKELDPGRNTHLARCSPLLVITEAFPRRSTSTHQTAAQPYDLPTGAIFEEPLAAALILSDPRQMDGTANLALLHCANNPAALEHLLESIRPILVDRGSRTLIGPTEISPHLGVGILQDHWSDIPPIHTPFGPPYLPELLSGPFTPGPSGHLFHLRTGQDDNLTRISDSAIISPIKPDLLKTDLREVLKESFSEQPGFPPPDDLELSFLLRWIHSDRIHVWIARVGGQPVGLMAAKPDLAALIRQTKGGRSLSGRLWLSLNRWRPVQQGRLLFLGVLPRWRMRGIGRQLIAHLCGHGTRLGWQSLSIGPVPADSIASKFLSRLGATSQQTYTMYKWDIIPGQVTV